MAQTDPLLRLVLEYATAPTWEEARNHLQHQRDALLTPKAERLLDGTITVAEAQSPTAFPQAHRYAAQLRERLTFLQRASQNGIDAAWQERQRATNPPLTRQDTTDDGQEEPRAEFERAAHQDLPQLVLDWLNTTSYADQRDFLAAHRPALLDPQAEVILTAIAEQYCGAAEAPFLTASLLWLQVARAEGLAAGWQAFKKTMDLGLEDRQGSSGALPPEIQQLLDEATHITTLSQMPRMVTLLTKALHMADEQGIDPYARAAILNSLGNGHAQNPQGPRRENLELAIACYTQALRVYTAEAYPEDYAMTQNNLGAAYQHRIAGERRENLELAIACYTQALRVYTAEAYPEDYAMTQNNLGNTYGDRIAGERRENLELAIACYTQALRVYTAEAYPEDYAMTQNNVGAAYRDRIAGGRRENLELAIACYTQALRVRTYEAYPADYAMTQNNLGNTYQDRIVGGRRENLELAIACYTEALRVYTAEAYPEQYAMTQNNLGNTYQTRIAGERRENLELAIACYTQALRVRTLSDFPIDHRDTQLNLAWAALDGQVSEANARGDPTGVRVAYALAHTAYLAARQAQTELRWLESEAQGQALLQGGSHPLREAYAHDAWCCWHLGDIRGAMLALEAGRALALVEAQSLAEVSFRGIRGDLVGAFKAARDAWDDARARGLPLRGPRDALLAARTAIIDSGHPEFLPGTPTWDEIAAAPAPGQALIYLAATDFGGLVLAVPAGGEPWGTVLSDLTWQAVNDWLFTPDIAGMIVGGYRLALDHRERALLGQWIQYQADKDEQYERWGTRLRRLPALIDPAFATLKTALTAMVAAWSAEAERIQPTHPDRAALFRARLDMSLAELLGSSVFLTDLRWHYMQAELEALLAKMGAAVTLPLRAALDAHGLGHPDQPLALILCGRLGALPVHAAPARTHAHGEAVPFLETCELTLQAAARSLGTARQALHQLQAAGPVLALGNPDPTWITVKDDAGTAHRRVLPPLPWAAAEADAIDAVAASAKPTHPRNALIGDDATRQALLNHLLAFARDRAGAWVQVAAHGSSNPTDPRRSAMFLAQGETISLVDLQQGLLLAGVRLFVASGCVTGLGDLETAPDELGSFAAGLLQAGAAGALATLWSVNDQATFALMLRFAQYYLYPVTKDQPPISPSKALRSAIHWLRTVKREELVQLKALAKGRIPTLATASLAGREVDAERGADLLEADLERLAKPTEDLLGRIARINEHGPEGVPPCRHPIFWAAFILYGV